MDRDGERDRVSGGGGPTRSALFCSPAYPILEIHQMQEIDCCSTKASCNNLHSPIHTGIPGGREVGSGRKNRVYQVVDGAGGPWKSHVRAQLLCSVARAQVMACNLLRPAILGKSLADARPHPVLLELVGVEEGSAKNSSKANRQTFSPRKERIESRRAFLCQLRFLLLTPALFFFPLHHVN